MIKIAVILLLLLTATAVADGSGIDTFIWPPYCITWYNQCVLNPGSITCTKFSLYCTLKNPAAKGGPLIIV